MAVSRGWQVPSDNVTTVNDDGTNAWSFANAVKPSASRPVGIRQWLMATTDTNNGTARMRLGRFSESSAPTTLTPEPCNSLSPAYGPSATGGAGSADAAVTLQGNPYCSVGGNVDVATRRWVRGWDPPRWNAVPILPANHAHWLGVIVHAPTSKPVVNGGMTVTEAEALGDAPSYRGRRWVNNCLRSWTMKNGISGFDGLSTAPLSCKRYTPDINYRNAATWPEPSPNPAAQLNLLLGGGPAAYNIAADPGVYVVTGSAAALLATRRIAADPGVYTITGSAAALALMRRIAADPGVYAITGSAAGLVATRLLGADPGIYTIAGSAAALQKGFRMTADPGVYAITGSAADLRRLAALLAEPGVYTLTGSAAAFAKSFLFAAAPGVYTISGSDATLVFTGGGAPATPNEYYRTFVHNNRR